MRRIAGTSCLRSSAKPGGELGRGSDGAGRPRGCAAEAGAARQSCTGKAGLSVSLPARTKIPSLAPKSSRAGAGRTGDWQQVGYTRPAFPEALSGSVTIPPD